MIRILNRQRRVHVSLSRVREQIAVLRDSLGATGRDLSVVFVDDARMKKACQQYEQRNKTTDILSFPAHEADVRDCLRVLSKY